MLFVHCEWCCQISWAVCSLIKYAFCFGVLFLRNTLTYRILKKKKRGRNFTLTLWFYRVDLLEAEVSDAPSEAGRNSFWAGREPICYGFASVLFLWHRNNWKQYSGHPPPPAVCTCFSWLSLRQLFPQVWCPGSRHISINLRFCLNKRKIPVVYKQKIGAVLESAL